MTDQRYTPAELFRLFHRGLIDHNTLHSHVLLILIDQAETQQMLQKMLAALAEELARQALDIEALAQHLGLPRPSQQEPPSGDPDENGRLPDEPDED